MKFTISMRNIHAWFDGEIAPALDVAEQAEAAGMDQLSVVDHILMSDDLSGYPYGGTHFVKQAHWWEPMALLGSLAARTRRIRLATSVIVAPLRPAALLAKQFTTLDRLSGGRIDAGLGVGWQKAEYDACGVPFANRFAQLEEQIQVLRSLWRDNPASFDGRYNSYEGIWQLPQPVQQNGIPIWLGIGDSDRSLNRVAEFADGWCPPSNDIGQLAKAFEKLRGLFAERNRDFGELQVRAVLPTIMGSNGPDLDASLATVDEYRKIGVTMMEITPSVFGTALGDLGGMLGAIRSAR